MKISNKKLSSVLERAALQRLLRDIRRVGDIPELNMFLNEMFTDMEKRIVIRRMVVAVMLEKGNKYREIRDILGISQITISKVRDILEKRGYGRNPKRRRVYSFIPTPKKKRPILPSYKGAPPLF